MTAAKVAKYNKSNVNWNKFFSAVATVGNTMNSQKDRFDKSDLIEKALAHYSNGAIEYTNLDGVDHILTNLNNTTQEFKFVSSVFYGMRVTQRKTKTRPQIKELNKLGNPVTVKLTNSHGGNKRTALPATYAKYLMVADNYSAYVIAVEDLTPYLAIGGDGIEAKNVPANLFTEVVNPDEYTVTSHISNYKEKKNKMQEDFLNQF